MRSLLSARFNAGSVTLSQVEPFLAQRLHKKFSSCKHLQAPLDINDFREGKGGDVRKLHELQLRRFKEPSLIDRVVELDNKWRDAVFKVEALKRDFNAHNKRIGLHRKIGQDTTSLQNESKQKKAAIEAAQAETQSTTEQRDAALNRIGNHLHEDVPQSNNEADNIILRSWGSPRYIGDDEEKLFNHVDLAERLGILDQQNGVEVAGSRGYYLKGAGLFLNQALIQYGLQFGYDRGLEPIMTPFFMKKSVMKACAQLSQFDDELYKVIGGGEDKYLVATAEQPLCALHKDKWFEEKDLPLKYVGYSCSFRKEAGSHGRDTAGIFRVHQFDKVEQFTVASPFGNLSWQAFEDMVENTEDFYQSLELPYRITDIVSGALNNAAARKHDLEAWFPSSATYRELVSCSNCLDYQARALNARLRPSVTHSSEEKGKGHVHMLNCTLTATERTLCCILENYQTSEGVEIPKVLRQYMPQGLSFIPFRL